MFGLNNIAAIEGAAFGVKCNGIMPSTMPRMAGDMDRSLYPAEVMHAGLVSPLVGYLAHESCPVSGEVYISMAGRVDRAYVAETMGVWRKDWSIEEIACQFDAIRNTDETVAFTPVQGRVFACIPRAAPYMRFSTSSPAASSGPERAQIRHVVAAA